MIIKETLEDDQSEIEEEPPTVNMPDVKKLEKVIEQIEK